MARPLKQGIDYFPHDTDASNDEKIEYIEALYGLAGYAFYFKILERIYRSGIGYMDFSDEMTEKIWAKNLNIRINIFKKMLESCVKVGLFSQEEWMKDRRITSEAVMKRMREILFDRKRMREKRAQNNPLSPEQIHHSSPINSEQTSDQSDIKEIKLKESKINKSKPDVTKSQTEISDLAVKLAEKLKSLILTNNPIAKVPGDLRNWQIEFNRLLRLDKRPGDLVYKVLEFSQRDAFWSTNILSAKTFREKFDQLYMRMNKQEGENGFKSNRQDSRALPIKYETPEEFLARRRKEQHEDIRK